jgi:hypothetical protein
MGLDYPFMPGTTYTPAVEELELCPELTDADRRAVAFENAARLFPALSKRLGWRETS